MMSDVLLGVNIDHVATLRNVRGDITYPDPVQAAYVVEQAGADGVTMHLREDSRHITERDVKLIREVIQITMNLEISPNKEMVDFACQIQPHYCCLVPERRDELTTEGGLDLINCSNINKLKDTVAILKDFGIRVSLFIDPDIDQISMACGIGVTCIELHTGCYANAFNKKNQIFEYDRIQRSVQFAKDYGLHVNVGHGLTYYNVHHIAMLPYVKELNIGHAIVSRAVFCGLYKAVKDMKKILKESRGGIVYK